MNQNDQSHPSDQNIDEVHFFSSKTDNVATMLINAIRDFIHFLN